MTTIICPYCKKEFKKNSMYQRFCCKEHRIRYYNIGKCKEIAKLSEYELKLYKEIKIMEE